MLAIELPPEIEVRLERLARKTGRPKADHVQEAVIEYLEDLEDYDTAEERTRDHLTAIPIDEMERRLELED